MNLEKYKTAPYSIQLLKLNDYVRVFNSEPVYSTDKKYNIFLGPSCGFKPVKISENQNFKKMIFFDISLTQLEFYKFFIANFKGFDMSGVVRSFKNIYYDSIFKTDVNSLDLSFYDQKLDETIKNWFQSKKAFLKAWDKFLEVEKEFVHLDLIKNFESLQIAQDDIYFWLSNIFDFEIYKQTTNINLDKRLSKLSNHYNDKNIIFDLQYGKHSGLFTSSGINNFT
jgi:hypothetical protein